MIRNPYSKCPLVQEIQDTSHNLQESSNKIHIIWVPSHIGITGNEAADKLAREAANSHLDTVEFQLPYDRRNHLKEMMKTKWQNVWTLSTNKLSRIEPDIISRRFPNLDRRNNTIIRRVRIGHTRLTHGHILDKTPAPRCDMCNVVLTVQYLLVDCPKYTRYRDIHGLSGDLQEILTNLEQQTLLSAFCSQLV